jgi:hypothetical protein
MKLDTKAVERAVASFEEIELGDPRRAERLRRAMQLLAASPQSTLPEAMGSAAELKGLYRFLNSDFVDAEVLNEQHARTTAERARESGRAYAIHDTTEFELAHADPEAVGYLRTGRAGFEVHYTLVVEGTSEAGRPLGIANVEALFRDQPPRKRSKRRGKRKKKSGAETSKDPERRSLRWSRGFAKAEAALEGVEVIHLADREGDNYELLGRAVQNEQRFVVRVRVQERKVRSGDEAGSLKSVVERCAGVMKRSVPLSTRRKRDEPQADKVHPPRASRMAELHFSATGIVLSRPRYQADDLPEQLQLNVVRVFEPRPPLGEKPIEWLLYTTEPISTPAEVAAVVDAYRSRWLIEECNKALKTGCKYEERQIESRHALLTLLAMTLPIACEVLWLRSCARRKPDEHAERVLSQRQVQVLRSIGPRKLGPRPTVRDALWAVAGLGGHLANNGEPGWQVLHRGMLKLLAYEEGWSAARGMRTDL